MTKIIDTVLTKCCHAPIVREFAGDEVLDFCWECGQPEPEIEDGQ